jgi:hypothetical protein
MLAVAGVAVVARHRRPEWDPGHQHHCILQRYGSAVWQASFLTWACEACSVTFVTEHADDSMRFREASAGGFSAVSIWRDLHLTAVLDFVC